MKSKYEQSKKEKRKEERKTDMNPSNITKLMELLVKLSIIIGSIWSIFKKNES